MPSKSPGHLPVLRIGTPTIISEIPQVVNTAHLMNMQRLTSLGPADAFEIIRPRCIMEAYNTPCQPLGIFYSLSRSIRITVLSESSEIKAFELYFLMLTRCDDFLEYGMLLKYPTV